MAPNSSARWPSTRTCRDSATCEALRASSSRWPRNSSETFTAFGETGGALGAPSTRSHGSQPSCFLAYLRRGFVRRTKPLLASLVLSHFFLLQIARIEPILTIIGHVLGKIIVPAQTRTLRKREETFSAPDLSTKATSPKTRLHQEPDSRGTRSVAYLYLSVVERIFLFRRNEELLNA
jgi:hypothetical protein